MPVYSENLVLVCLSDEAKKNIDKVKLSDAVKENDGEVIVNIELIENAVKKILKEEEKKRAEQERKEQEKREAERLRKEQEEKNSLYNKYAPGTVHTMGMYNHGTGTREIEWKVLERNGSKALLISKYILDRMEFNGISEDTCWEKCSLRKWLNNEFYNVAFSTAEKNKILPSRIKNTPNPQHGTSSGNDTYDKLFLLSADEVYKYYKTFAETRCQVTLFAKNRGAYCDGAYFGYWWLRTTGQYMQNASYIFYTGGVSVMGYDVTGTIFGVRPAMWISLD